MGYRLSPLDQFRYFGFPVWVPALTSALLLDGIAAREGVSRERGDPRIMPTEEKPASRPRCILLISVVLGLAGMLGACVGPWRDVYFKKGVDRLTQEEIREKLGPPHTAKMPVLGGDSLWTYRLAMSENDLEPWRPTFLADASQSFGALVGKEGDAPKPTLYCYRYTLTFNEEKVLKSWKREECVPGTRASLTVK